MLVGVKVLSRKGLVLAGEGLSACKWFEDSDDDTCDIPGLMAVPFTGLYTGVVVVIAGEGSDIFEGIVGNALL